MCIVSVDDHVTNSDWLGPGWKPGQKNRRLGWPQSVKCTQTPRDQTRADTAVWTEIGKGKKMSG